MVNLHPMLDEKTVAYYGNQTFLLLALTPDGIRFQGMESCTSQSTLRPIRMSSVTVLR